MREGFFFRVICHDLSNVSLRQVAMFEMIRLDIKLTRFHVAVLKA